MYKTLEFPDLTELLRDRLPPNIKQISDTWRWEFGRAAFRPRNQEDNLRQGFGAFEMPLRAKRACRPMTRLYMYYLFNMCEPYPVHLYELAEKVGVMLSERYAHNNLEEIDVQWLDSNEDDGPRSYDELVWSRKGQASINLSIFKSMSI